MNMKATTRCLVYACSGRRARVFTVVLIAASVVGYGSPALNAQDQSSASDEIRNKIEQYAESINQADTTLAAKIWLNSPDVSFIHPLGQAHGFDQVKQDIYGHLMGETFSERKLAPHDISVHIYGDSAWAEFYWDFNAKFRKDGSPITTHGRETQVYWKTPDGWRLVHVHYSGMPVKQGGF